MQGADSAGGTGADGERQGQEIRAGGRLAPPLPLRREVAPWGGVGCFMVIPIMGNFSLISYTAPYHVTRDAMTVTVSNPNLYHSMTVIREDALYPEEPPSYTPLPPAWEQPLCSCNRPGNEAHT